MGNDATHKIAPIAAAALALARQQPLPPRPVSGDFTQAQILACSMLKLHLGLSFRALARLLAESPEIRAALGIDRAPSHALFNHRRHAEDYTTIAATLLPGLRDNEKPSDPANDVRLQAIIAAWPALTEVDREAFDHLRMKLASRRPTRSGLTHSGQ